MTRVAQAIILSVSLAATAGAQSVVPVHESRWQPFLGCWRPTSAIAPVAPSTSELVQTPASQMLCIVPGKSPTSVEIVNFAGGRITERTVIEPGQAITKTVGECSGTESATWSDDARRVYLRGTFNCGQGVKRVESGIMSIDADGDWVQAQSVTLNGATNTYVAHFHDTGIALEGIANGAIVERPLLDLDGKRVSPPRDGCTGTELVKPSADSSRVTVISDYTCAGGLHRIANAEFTRSVNGQWRRVGVEPALFGTASVRAAAGAPVSTNEVLEVSKAVDPAVAEGWLVDRGQGFELNGRELVRLADKGMPPRVIDMLVAVSNPTVFSLKRGTGAASVSAVGATNSARNNGGVGRGCGMQMEYCGGLMGVSWLYGADRYYGWSDYGYGYPYGSLSRYGSGYGYGYGNGYGGYGYGFPYYGPGYSNGGPVVIVNTGGSSTSQPRGRAVYGQGYTRDAGSSPSTQPRSSSGSGSSSSGSGSSGSGSSSGGSSSGSSSGGAARTAKPRGGG